MKKIKKYIAVLIVALLMVGVLSGCDDGSDRSSRAESTREHRQNSSEQDSEPEEMDESTEVDEEATEPVVEEVNQTLSERVGGKLYVGDEFTLGTYEQDNDLENGAEDIEWIVLEKTGEDTYLCISKYVLDAKMFNDEVDRDYTDAKNVYTYDGDYTVYNDWGISTIRPWLNGEFFDTAFTSEDKENITDTTNRVYVWESSGDDLTSVSYTDKVCLLNYGRLDEFPGCVKVTEYARAQGAPVIDDGTREHENCSSGWCLMSLHVDNLRAHIEYHHQKRDEAVDNYHEYQINPPIVEYYLTNPAVRDSWNMRTVALYQHTERTSDPTNQLANYGPSGAFMGDTYEEVYGIRPVITVTLGN